MIFFILESLEAFQKLYVSFTAVTAETLLQIVRNKYITVLDVYGEHLSVAACNSILNSVQNIKSLSISLDADIFEPEFRYDLKLNNRNCSIHMVLQNKEI